MDWIHQWIGLDWVRWLCYYGHQPGTLTNCTNESWTGRLDCYLLRYSFSLHFRFSTLKDVAYIHCCFFYFPVLTNIDYFHCYGFISYEHAALTAHMKSNSETYLMMFSPTE